MKTSRIILWGGIGAVIAIAALVYLCSGGPAGPNVILISLDTTRADRLSCYGYADETTPHIDAFAREAILFENAISPAPMTLPAHSSLMTGMIPPVHGVHGNIDYVLSDESVTLAERLRDQEYRTAAIVGAMILGAAGGISQGFDSFDDKIVPLPGLNLPRHERPGEEVSRLAESWLDQAGEDPFFLFVHYFDPHEPYWPPEPFASRFPGEPYAGEVGYTDHCVGRLLDKLKEKGLYESSLIVIVGDHGESLGEHGEIEHGFFVYRSTTHVPLIIKPPGATKGRRVNEPVSLIDVAPTTLSLLDISGPTEIQGRDLSPLFSESVAEFWQRPLYAESLVPTKYKCAPLLSVEHNGWKLIQAPKPELFQLRVDPLEGNNLFDQQQERAKFLQGELQSIIQECEQREVKSDQVSSSAARLAMLKSLGYTGGAVEEGFQFDTDKEDPKDYIEIYRRVEQMKSYMLRQDAATARRFAEEILAIRNDVPEAHQSLGQITMNQGDYQGALFHFQELLRLKPEVGQRGQFQNALGWILAHLDRPQEAIERFERALTCAEEQVRRSGVLGTDAPIPSDVLQVVFLAHSSMGDALLQEGRAKDAVNAYTRALQINSRSADVFARLGQAHIASGDATKAEAALRNALSIDPNHTASRETLEDLLQSRETAVP